MCPSCQNMSTIYLLLRSVLSLATCRQISHIRRENRKLEKQTSRVRKWSCWWVEYYRIWWPTKWTWFLLPFPWPYVYICVVTDNLFPLRHHFGTSAIMNTHSVVIVTYCGCLGQNGHEKGNQDVSIIKSSPFPYNSYKTKTMKFFCYDLGAISWEFNSFPLLRQS